MIVYCLFNNMLPPEEAARGFQDAVQKVLWWKFNNK